MIRRREIKKLRDDRPPFRPLTLEEVMGICRSGNFAPDDIPGRTFCVMWSLDEARRQYLNATLNSARRLTSKQLSQRLNEVRILADRLIEIVADGSLFIHAHRGILTRQARDQHTANCDHLYELREWAELTSDAMMTAEPGARVNSGAGAGLENLLSALICIWCGAVGDTNPKKGSGSPLVAFVQSAHQLITQRLLSRDTLARRVRIEFQSSVNSMSLFFTTGAFASYIPAERQMIELHELTELKHLHDNWDGYSQSMKAFTKAFKRHGVIA